MNPGAEIACAARTGTACATGTPGPLFSVAVACVVDSVVACGAVAEDEAGGFLLSARGLPVFGEGG